MFGGLRPCRKSFVLKGKAEPARPRGRPGSPNIRKCSYDEVSPSLFLNHHIKISSRASVNISCLLTNSLNSTEPPTSLEMLERYMCIG